MIRAARPGRVETVGPAGFEAGFGRGVGEYEDDGRRGDAVGARSVVRWVGAKRNPPPRAVAGLRSLYPPLKNEAAGCMRARPVYFKLKPIQAT